jgi:nucleotide-binding universal stress UspA family protein
MYQKILIPLDGSELAECVLPHVESIAKGCGSGSVIFVRVVEPTALPYGPFTDGGYVVTKPEADQIRKDLDANNKKQAEEYLNQITSQHKYPGLDVHSEVLTGKPADVIADYATDNEVDLIAIATHGRSGISRWTLGSVAERVLHSACVPVLMVRAPGCIPGIK